jgi:hypothetical protein
VYSLYITSRTEDVSCVLRDELAVVASISANPREHLQTSQPRVPSLLKSRSSYSFPSTLLKTIGDFSNGPVKFVTRAGQLQTQPPRLFSGNTCYPD